LAKNLKLKIKNTQLAEALQLDKFKKKKKEEIAKSTEKAPALEKKSPKEQPVEKKPLGEPEKTPPKQPTPTPQKVEKPPLRSQGVDDFRRPKIIRRKSAEPLKKSPVTRKDAESATKKPPPKEGALKEASQTEKAKEKAKEKEPPRKPGFFKDYGDVRSQRKPQQKRSFDARDRMGLRDSDDERWRKRRISKKLKGSEKEELTAPGRPDHREPKTGLDAIANVLHRS